MSDYIGGSEAGSKEGTMIEIKVQKINSRWTAMVNGKRRTYPEGSVIRDVIMDVLAPGVRVLVVPEVRR